MSLFSLLLLLLMSNDILNFIIISLVLHWLHADIYYYMKILDALFHHNSNSLVFLLHVVSCMWIKALSFSPLWTVYTGSVFKGKHNESVVENGIFIGRDTEWYISIHTVEEWTPVKWLIMS